MFCKIADILTSVPAAGDMAPRCRAYLTPGDESRAEIAIDAALYSCERWPGLSESSVAYMESARQFYYRLPEFDGLMLHASATVIDGEGYLFAGQCGIGKSTHAKLLQKLYPQARLINDDKPALRYVNGSWVAYGTPWCGKDGININTSCPVKAICLLTPNRDQNRIQSADPLAAVTGIISCSLRRGTREDFLKLTPLIDRLVKQIPIYQMDSLADEAAGRMAYETMKNGILK